MKKMLKSINEYINVMSLQKQLAFVMLLALIIAAFSFLLLLPKVLKPFYEQNIYEYLEQPAKLLKSNANNLNSNFAYIMKTKSGAIYVSNNLNSMFDDNITAREILKYITGTKGKFEYNKEKYYYYVDVADETTSIVFTNDKLISTQEKSLIRIILPTMITTTLIIMILIFAWSNNVVYKIKKLKYKTENIANPNFKLNEHFGIDDELNMLSKSIDKTREELREKEEYKNYMFQNLSHELKTPIAVIDSYIEGINDGVISSEEGFNIICEQTNKLKEQVNTILCFNKIDYMKEQNSIINQKIDVIEVIKNSVEQHKLLRPDVDFIVINKVKDARVIGTSDLWQIVVDNILSNFVRYANTKIAITVKKGKLEFFNDGKHIEAEIIKDMFSPYTKGKDGQTGLGLSIVKRVTDTFGYDISAKNMKDGVLFEIECKN